MILLFFSMYLLKVWDSIAIDHVPFYTMVFSILRLKKTVLEDIDKRLVGTLNQYVELLVCFS